MKIIPNTHQTFRPVKDMLIMQILYKALAAFICIFRESYDANNYYDRATI